MRLPFRLACPALVAAAIAAAPAGAQTLEQYEFQGQPGTETQLAPSFVLPGLSGLAFSEAGVTPVAGANSINASGFTGANDYYTFGFNVLSGHSATVNQLVLASRSSGTGPGLINVLASVDGGRFNTVGSITQSGTSYNDEFLSITPVTALTSVVFRLVAATTTAAAGGSVQSSGTFRIGDYNPAGTPTPFSLNGSITTLAAAAPEPGTWGLLIVGLGLIGTVLRRRPARGALA